jgi:hypothetical protein
MCHNNDEQIKIILKNYLVNKKKKFLNNIYKIFIFYPEKILEFPLFHYFIIFLKKKKKKIPEH